ncbi:hypothetical protein FNV43_RR06604 [Rhamnella rubrinervis]|uniref:Uncharacterized protein n=1 Tax=Rhamnella rubrinervis TaxID=2594499 RepID=A0A8K0HE48_9ROSA|nr:hypothetical protein FNV43_RR06604 [Rhamnella rubrinervis]
MEGRILLRQKRCIDPLAVKLGIGRCREKEAATEKERRKERRHKNRQAVAGEIEPTPGGTIIAQPRDSVAAATVEKSPPQKKQRSPSRGDKEPNTCGEPGLEEFFYLDSTSSRPNRPRLMTHRDRNILKSMPRTITRRGRARRQKWTPDPSEDEGDDGETSEISSTESEPKLDHQPEDPSLALEKSPTQTRDSFDEAMEEARTNTTGPSTNAKEVASASQPSQEEA